jgi:hypothetical protein
VDFAKSSEGATVADARREAIRTLLTLQRSDPAERLRQRQELFGEIEAAEVVGLPALTNGHTNGPANGNGGGHVLDAR